MTKNERMMQRLRVELGLKLPVDTTIERTYAGRNLKAGGAFSWYLRSEERPGVTGIGSPSTVTDLLRAKKLCIDASWGDSCIESDDPAGDKGLTCPNPYSTPSLHQMTAR